MHDLRGAGKMLADLQTGNGSGDWLENAPHLSGRVWLEVEGIQMAWAAIKPNQYARFGGGIVRRLKMEII